MVQHFMKELKDLGLQEEVMEALPYAVVGGAWEASFLSTQALFTALSHIVPSGQQLKILFLRIYTQEANGARFRIVETNPWAAGQTGPVEAFPVKGSVPPFAPTGITPTVAVRDYPFLEALGAEVLHGSLVDPIHVLEGSINFDVLNTPTPATGARYGLVWWGVEKKPDSSKKDFN